MAKLTDRWTLALPIGHDFDWSLQAFVVAAVAWTGGALVYELIA
jgi:hypothetical protein